MSETGCGLMQTADRPQLNRDLSAESFRDYYWLKEELVSFCQETGINSSGRKGDISDRISNYLETGKIIVKPQKRKTKAASRFDWNQETLTADTIITDNYKNTENVRVFFRQEIGKHFKFNTLFMHWMKANQGKTLGEAITEWQRIAELKKSETYKTEIAPQFEYNLYTRAFHTHNPGLSAKDARHCWKMKKSEPGHNQYEDTDLRFLE
jgi:hypothetical protein